MKHIVLELIYLCLGIIALYVRITLKADSDTLYYMSLINKFAGFVTVIMILFHALISMIKDIKQQKRSLKRIKWYFIFSIVIISIYWFAIIEIYHKFDAAKLNDIVTLVTLTIALTDDLWSVLLQTLFYKR